MREGDDGKDGDDFLVVSAIYSLLDFLFLSRRLTYTHTLLQTHAGSARYGFVRSSSSGSSGISNAIVVSQNQERENRTVNTAENVHSPTDAGTGTGR